MYDLFECLCSYMDNGNLTSIPINFISPVADSSFALANKNAVNSNESITCNRKDLYAICSYSSLKKSDMFLCTPFANRYLIFSDWAFEMTLHSSSARRDSPCADSPDRD